MVRISEEEGGDWKVVVPKRVVRETEKLPGAVRREVHEIIAELKKDPKPMSSAELRNNNNIFGIHFYYGEHPKKRRHAALYRIIYRVFEASHTVELLRIARRDEQTYSGFNRW